MKRQYFYASVSGLTEEQMKAELEKFLSRLEKEYAARGFGATVLGITRDAAERVEKILHE